MKKIVRTEAAPGLFVETLLVAVPAIVVLAVLHRDGQGTFGNAGTGHAVLLLGSGIATAVPLLLFAAAARRIPLSTVGLLYLTPLMQLSIGVFVYDEPCRPSGWPVSPSSGWRWRCSPATCCDTPGRAVGVRRGDGSRRSLRASGDRSSGCRPQRRETSVPRLRSPRATADTRSARYGRRGRAMTTYPRGLPATGRGVRGGSAQVEPGAVPSGARDAHLRAAVVAAGGAKETAIRDRFGVTPTRYYQVLNALVDRPDALALDPLLVRRLRRLRLRDSERVRPEVLGNESDNG